MSNFCTFFGPFSAAFSFFLDFQELLEISLSLILSLIIRLSLSLLLSLDFLNFVRGKRLASFFVIILYFTLLFQGALWRCTLSLETAKNLKSNVTKISSMREKFAKRMDIFDEGLLNADNIHPEVFRACSVSFRSRSD